MNTEVITTISKVALHRYNGGQCETALYAESDRRPGYRWYVGHGGDYCPASKWDISNFSEFTSCNGKEIDMARNYYTGKLVHMY